MSETGPKWTDAQRAAIRHEEGALLLSAAAGSGKTAVLAERCVHLVCDAESPCDIDELLVVSFTRAAAGEMRDRIERRLRERASREGDNDRMQRQLRLLDRAAITTLDAFCGSLVRSHFHLVGVDPAFAMLAPEDAALLRVDVCDAMLEEAYDSSETTAFTHLLDAYFEGDDTALRQEILSTHELLQSIVDPPSWRDAMLARLTISTRAEPSALARDFMTLQQRAIASSLRSIEQTAKLAEESGLSAYAAHSRDLAAELIERKRLSDEGDLDTLAAQVEAWKAPRLPSVRGEAPPQKEMIKDRIDAVKKAMKEGDLRRLCRCRWDQLRTHLATIHADASTFFLLVERFASQYESAKRLARSLDFSDTQRLALRILTDNVQTMLPSSAATEVQRRFRYVLVDEFQDVNPLQDAIVRLASTDRAAELGLARRSNLFAVGDVKQSIYRFRLAEPQQFVDRATFLRSTNQALGTVIDLQQNFRSRGPFLDAVNDVFRLLMTSESASIHYDNTHELRPGAVYPTGASETFVGKPIELHLLPAPRRGEAEPSDDAEHAAPDGYDRFEREIALVARRIRELICVDESQRVHVMEKSATGMTQRLARFGDIAVLLRSARHKASVVADQLRAEGIPVHADDTTGFFAATEVQDVLSLLRVLSNRRQDIPLAALLRSPLAGVPDGTRTLAAIRAVYADEAFHRAVVRYAAEQPGEDGEMVATFLKRLDRWRDEARDRSVVDLLHRIFSETNYATFCRALPGGAQRVANLEEIISRAAQFDTFERQGVDRFLRFLTELEASDAIGRPPMTSGSTDVVRVITVHKSKGLEFPIVIVPDLGKQFNEQSLASPVLVDRDHGIGMMGVDLDRRVRFPSAASLVVRNHIRRQALAEEIRVLYVAMTRAREHLILVGTAKDNAIDRWREDWADMEGPLPDDLIQSARSALDWIGPIAAMTERQRLGTFDVRVESAPLEADDKQTGCETTPIQQRLSDWLDAATVWTGPSSEVVANAEQRLTFRYAHDAATIQRATQAITDIAADTKDLSVTGTTSGNIDEVADENSLIWPMLYRPATHPRAADVGSAVHRFLQHANLHRPLDEADTRAQLAELVQRHAMTADEAAMVNVEAIAWFSQSQVAGWMRSAGTTLYREQPLARAQSFDGGTAGDFVLTRGRMDVLIDAPEGLTLIDYKTDRVTPEQVDAKVATYAPQLLAYAEAIAALLNRRAIRVVMVFLTAREIRVLSEDHE